MPQSVPEKARRICFNTPRGEVSRRDLFHSLVPQYRAIPYIEPLKCVGERCDSCRQSCPFKAIIFDGAGVSIDGRACRGCGVCISACPRGAIVHPQSSLDQLNVELERLILDDANEAHPKLVAMLCQSSRYSSGGSESNVFERAGGFLAMEMPCLSLASPWLMLRAFGLGAQGLALICERERCQFRLDGERWQGTVQFVQALLNHWGIRSERVTLFGERNLGQELVNFGQAVARLAPIWLRQPMALGSPAEDVPLAALIQGMGERLGVAPAGVISAGSVPFGKLALDGGRCTGCGLCAADCPTGALVLVSSGLDGYQLTFSHRSCSGCGLCAKVCPEECLRVERVLELDKLGDQPRSVSEGGLVHCAICGAMIAPRAMVEKIRARMAALGGNTSRLEICSNCKMGIKPKPAKSRAGL